MSMLLYTPPPDSGLEILYIDQDLLVVNKPSGLLSVPGRGEDKQDCMASRARTQYPDAMIVHRLDLETSGILLMARGKLAQRQLGIAFETRQTSKRYVAVVDGQMTCTTGEIDLPLICDWPNRPRQKVDHEVGKPSLTRYRVLGYDPLTDTSRVELQPITGRSHQLRVHLCALGHAIIGDRLYASPTAAAKSDRLLLHATRLEITHPLRGEALSFQSTAPF